MDHQEQHHQKHRHERDEKKHHEQGRPHRGFHPAWYVVVAAVLIGIALAIWTFVLPPVPTGN